MESDDLAEPPLVLRGFPGFVTAVEFSPDGSTLAASDIIGNVKLYDIPRTEEPNTLRGHYVAFSEDGTSLLTSIRGGACTLWDPATCALKSEIELPSELGDRRSFSADFSKVATITAAGAVELWHLGTHEHYSLAGQHISPAEGVLLSPDGKSLAINSGGRVQVWDMSSRTAWAVDTYRKLNKGSNVFMGFSPDSTRLVTGYEEKPLESFSVRCWDLTGTLIATFNGHDTPIRTIAFSSDQRLLATASWTGVKIWDLRTGELKQTLQGCPTIVNSLAFTPDGQRLASGGFDGTVKLWDALTGDEMITLHGHQNGVACVTFSPKTGKTLASADWGRTVRLWRAESGED
jgi:WD40 repeat protein